MSGMCAITRISRLDHSVPALALVERDADAFFFTPNDMATPLELIARYKSVKRSGINKGVTTSSAAPVSEMLRTMQSIPPSPNPMVPAFNVRRRSAVLS